MEGSNFLEIEVFGGIVLIDLNKIWTVRHQNGSNEIHIQNIYGAHSRLLVTQSDTAAIVFNEIKSRLDVKSLRLR